jgi:hypothetical protein
MLYYCRHRIMQYLKQTGFKKPNPNKPSQLFKKHQAEVKKQCDNIGKNVHQIQSDITTMFRAIPTLHDVPAVPAVPLPKPPIRPALNIRDSTILEADLSNNLMDLQNGARQQEEDNYEAFNPPPRPRSVMKVHFNPETPQALLKRHQAEADAAYRKNDISFV